MVKSILDYWKTVNKWRNPGYHRLIDVEGNAFRLADFSAITNGVKGYNHNSIHISYIGGVDDKLKPLDNRTFAQKWKILDCIGEALIWVRNNQEDMPKIVGHHDLNPGKACPSFYAKKEYAWIVK